MDEPEEDLLTTSETPADAVKVDKAAAAAAEAQAISEVKADKPKPQGTQPWARLARSATMAIADDIGRGDQYRVRHGMVPGVDAQARADAASKKAIKDAKIAAARKAVALAQARLQRAQELQVDSQQAHTNDRLAAQQAAAMAAASNGALVKTVVEGANMGGLDKAFAPSIPAAAPGAPQAAAPAVAAASGTPQAPGIPEGMPKMPSPATAEEAIAAAEKNANGQTAAKVAQVANATKMAKDATPPAIGKMPLTAAGAITQAEQAAKANVDAKKAQLEKAQAEYSKFLPLNGDAACPECIKLRNQMKDKYDDLSEAAKARNAAILKGKVQRQKAEKNAEKVEGEIAAANALAEKQQAARSAKESADAAIEAADKKAADSVAEVPSTDPQGASKVSGQADALGKEAEKLQSAAVAGTGDVEDEFSEDMMGADEFLSQAPPVATALLVEPSSAEPLASHNLKKLSSKEKTGKAAVQRFWAEANAILAEEPAPGSDDRRQRYSAARAQASQAEHQEALWQHRIATATGDYEAQARSKLRAARAELSLQQQRLMQALEPEEAEDTTLLEQNLNPDRRALADVDAEGAQRVMAARLVGDVDTDAAKAIGQFEEASNSAAEAAITEAEKSATASTQASTSGEAAGQEAIDNAEASNAASAAADIAITKANEAAEETTATAISKAEVDNVPIPSAAKTAAKVSAEVDTPHTAAKPSEDDKSKAADAAIKAAEEEAKQSVEQDVDMHSSVKDVVDKEIKQQQKVEAVAQQRARTKAVKQIPALNRAAAVPEEGTPGVPDYTDEVIPLKGAPGAVSDTPAKEKPKQPHQHVFSTAGDTPLVDGRPVPRDRASDWQAAKDYLKEYFVGLEKHYAHNKGATKEEAREAARIAAELAKGRILEKQRRERKLAARGAVKSAQKAVEEAERKASEMEDARLKGGDAAAAAIKKALVKAGKDTKTVQEARQGGINAARDAIKKALVKAGKDTKTVQETRQGGINAARDAISDAEDAAEATTRDSVKGYSLPERIARMKVKVSEAQVAEATAKGLADIVAELEQNIRQGGGATEAQVQHAQAQAQEAADVAHSKAEAVHALAEELSLEMAKVEAKQKSLQAAANKVKAAAAQVGSSPSAKKGRHTRPPAEAPPAEAPPAEEIPAEHAEAGADATRMADSMRMPPPASRSVQPPADAAAPVAKPAEPLVEDTPGTREKTLQQTLQKTLQKTLPVPTPAPFVIPAASTARGLTDPLTPWLRDQAFDTLLEEKDDSAEEDLMMLLQEETFAEPVQSTEKSADAAIAKAEQAADASTAAKEADISITKAENAAAKATKKKALQQGRMIDRTFTAADKEDTFKESVQDDTEDSLDPKKDNRVYNVTSMEDDNKALEALKAAADAEKPLAATAHDLAVKHAKLVHGATRIPKHENKTWTKTAGKGQDWDAAAGYAVKSNPKAGAPWGGSGLLQSEPKVDGEEYWDLKNDSGVLKEIKDEKAEVQGAHARGVHKGREMVGAFTVPQHSNDSWFNKSEQDVSAQIYRQDHRGHRFNAGVSDGAFNDRGDVSVDDNSGEIVGNVNGGHATGTANMTRESAEAEAAAPGGSIDVPESLVQVLESPDPDEVALGNFTHDLKDEMHNVRNASDMAVHKGREIEGAFTKPKAQNESWFRNPGGQQDVSQGIYKQNHMGHLFTSAIGEGSFGNGGDVSEADNNDGEIDGNVDGGHASGTANMSRPEDLTRLILINKASDFDVKTDDSPLNTNATNEAAFDPEAEDAAFKAQMEAEQRVANGYAPNISTSAARYEESEVIPHNETQKWRASQDITDAIYAQPHPTPAPSEAPALEAPTFTSDAPPRPDLS